MMVPGRILHFLKARAIAPEEMYAESECAIKETENPSLMDEIDGQAQDEQLNRQLERCGKQILRTVRLRLRFVYH